MHVVSNRQKVLTLLIAIFAISMLFIATVTNAVVCILAFRRKGHGGDEQ